MSNNPTRKVLVMHLVGGIGNQLFVYYAGKVLANQVNRNLSLDFSDVNRGHNMDDISKLNISCFSESSAIKRALKRLWLYKYVDALKYNYRIPNRLKGSLLFPLMETEIGELCKFKKRNRIHVAGYFQTPNYFDTHQHLFPYSNLLSDHSELISKPSTINWNRTLGVHVRRGDYLGHRNTFGLLSKEWYCDALKFALNMLETKIDTIVFFTNDSEWVSKNLEPVIDTVRYKVIVEKDSESTSATGVLKEMQRCEGLVISNSTFSLMGAFHSSATVFTPDTFFRKQESSLLKDERENWFKVKSRWED
jgi:hypothetical protein